VGDVSASLPSFYPTEQGAQQGSADTHTIQVILLDEIGLAEQSPHLPLKVLHNLLDERCGRVGVVGRSNWALDPAKMNRAVHLFWPAPSEYDPSCTAKALANDPALRRHLSNLASAYYRIYQSQTHDNFFGFGDFYSLVRTLAVAMKTKDDEEPTEGCFEDDKNKQQAQVITSEALMRTVLRNFGGRPCEERDGLLRIFYKALGLSMPVLMSGVEDLVRANLTSVKHAAPHLLLLTRTDAALDLLFAV
jgi:hypothetical protein